MTKIASLLAAAGIASSACIQEDCLDTYLLNNSTKAVSVEPEFTERVRDISLTMEARNYPYDYRGEHVYGENLRLKCRPSADNDCALSFMQYEFHVNYIAPDGQVIPAGGDNTGFLRSLDIMEFELHEGAEGGRIECIVWSPECATKGHIEYINGVRHFVADAWRQRTLVGKASVEVGLSLVCPAPIPPFEPVDEGQTQQPLKCDYGKVGETPKGCVEVTYSETTPATDYMPPIMYLECKTEQGKEGFFEGYVQENPEAEKYCWDSLWRQ